MTQTTVESSRSPSDEAAGVPAAAGAPALGGEPPVPGDAAARVARHDASPDAAREVRDAVHVTVWRPGGMAVSDGLDGLATAIGDPLAFTWIDLTSCSPRIVGDVARILGLHPLVAEDIVERNQRAKSEVVESVLHIVLFSLALDGDQLYDREIDFVLGERFLLSSHSRYWDPRATHHLRSGPAAVLAQGPDRLLWALADDIVDEYFPVLDRLGDEIDELQDQIVDRADRSTLGRLFELKRRLISVRRVTAPEREIFNLLTDRDLGLVRPAQVLYFRDLYDHLIRLTDELDNYRDLVSGALDAYLSSVNNNLSVIMKRLTGVTVILAGIGAIGGLFGMSEAGAAFNGAEAIGFWIVVGAAIAIALVAAAVLHHLDWI